MNTDGRKLDHRTLTELRRRGIQLQACALRLRYATLRANGSGNMYENVKRGDSMQVKKKIARPARAGSRHLHGCAVMRKWLLLLMLLMLIQAVSMVHVDASVEIIAKCGELSGYIYEHARARWEQDRIGGGSTFITEEDGQYDIVFRDATGNLQSAKKGGARIVPANGRENTMHIIAIYPGIVTEVYSFDKDLSLLTLHAERLFPYKTSKTMTAECS